MDGHIHMMRRHCCLGGDISGRYANGQVDLGRMSDGGIDALFFSISSSEEYYPRRLELKSTLRVMDLALQQIERNRNSIEVARNAREIERGIHFRRGPGTEADATHQILW